MKKAIIVLEIEYDDMVVALPLKPPNEWDWDTLLDLHPDERCNVVYYNEVK